MHRFCSSRSCADYRYFRVVVHSLHMALTLARLLSGCLTLGLKSVGAAWWSGQTRLIKRISEHKCRRVFSRLYFSEDSDVWTASVT